MAKEIIEGPDFQVEVIRTKRKKTFQIQVNYDQVALLSPRAASKKQLENLITSRTAWIQKKLAQQDTRPRPVEHQFEAGEQFLFLGETYTLQLYTGAKQVGRQSGSVIAVTIPKRVTQRAEYIKQTLIDWYKQMALEILQTRTGHYAKQLGVTPQSLKVRTFKSRWGSCSSKGELLFNWKLVMTNEWIIDYVVVHELCHLLHHNHSPDFWQCVAQAQPDFRQRKQWLNKNSGLLEI
ncbi:MAG: SprT family zinc-dependent metalloprotease [Pseudomonadota bacterium]